MKQVIWIGMMLFILVLTGCGKSSTSTQSLASTNTTSEPPSTQAASTPPVTQAKENTENTDKIYYQVDRYSANGKTIVEGKYVLSPAPNYKLKEYGLENEGFDTNLDSKSFVVEGSFFKGYPPTGKFDIFYVTWKKGSRQEALDVSIGHRDSSRGW